MQAYGVLRDVPSVTRLALALVAALLLAMPAAAQASDTQVSMMMDDDNLLYRGDAVRDQTMTRMKQVGVDVVRVTVLWSVVAERAKSSKRRARRFDPTRRRRAGPPGPALFFTDPAYRFARAATVR